MRPRFLGTRRRRYLQPQPRCGFQQLAGTALGLLCGPFILACCLASALLPGSLLRFASARKNRPKEEGIWSDPCSLLGNFVVGSIMLGLSIALLYLAFHIQPESHYAPARPAPVPVFVWRDKDLDRSKRVTVNRIALNMTYDEVIQLVGKPKFAWHHPRPGIVRRVFTESEVEQLRAKGLAAFPTVATVRFNDGSAVDQTEVDFDSDGRAVQVYGRSLELDGHRIATRDSEPPWLPPLKQTLPPPDELQMISHEWRDYYYRGLGLRIDVAKKLTFSLHSERHKSIL